jgi:hypothetical protein
VGKFGDQTDFTLIEFFRLATFEGQAVEEDLTDK